jgi:hypothetical protein
MRASRRVWRSAGAREWRPPGRSAGRRIASPCSRVAFRMASRKISCVSFRETHLRALHLLLEHTERLIDIVVADEDLQETFPSLVESS